MKWYKKQLDALEEKASKKSSVKTGKGVATKTSTKHSFDLIKTGLRKSSFPNPVEISKKNRPKTDVY